MARWAGAKRPGAGCSRWDAEAAKHIALDIATARVAVQGFGNVGDVADKLFAEAGARIVAVQDHGGMIYREAGLDVPSLLKHVLETGSVVGFVEAEKIPDDKFWDVDCEILIPAALEQQITRDNAGRIKARMIIEGANGPTTPEADHILQERNVLILPGVRLNGRSQTSSPTADHQTQLVR